MIKFLLIFCLSSFELLFAQQKHVSIQLRWHHQFQFAGYYAALHKGFYKEEGLDVTLKEGGSSINALEHVLSQKAEFGVSNSSLVIDYLNGADVIMLGPIFQHSPNILLARKEYQSPVDLAKGGAVSLLSGDQDIELKAMFLKEGIELSKVNFVQNKNHLQDLLEDKVVAMNAYSSNEPFLLRQKNIPFSIIEPRNYGLDFYGDTLFTSKAFYQTDPITVEKFRKATMRGWQYALAHVDETIELIFTHYNTQLKTKEHLKYEAEVLKKLIDPDFVEIGHSNPGRWEHIVETYKMFSFIKGNRKLENFYYHVEQKVDLTRFYISIARALLVACIFACVAYYIYSINKRLEKVFYRHKILFQNSAAAGIVWKEDYTITEWNTQAQKIFGWSADEAIGKNFFDFLVPQEEHALVKEHYKQILNDHEMHIFIYKSCTKEGKIVLCEWRNIILPRSKEREDEMVSLAIDITQKHHEEAQLKKQATHDTLTSLPNRLYFEESLQKKYALSKREGSRFGVAFIDLDGFKAINDDYCHNAGDVLLKTLARRFQKIIRQEDTIARLGGDEFALLLNMHDKNEPYDLVMTRILEAAAKPVYYNKHALGVSASVGISFYSEYNDVSVDALVHQADTAMYEAKKSGKNRYCIFKGEWWMAKEWCESYSLNHEKIDAQHKELFRLANCVEALDAKTTTKEVLASLLKEFFAYMREHFKEEETYMESIGYPYLKEHQALHEDIINAMTAILKETKGIEVLQAKMKTVSHKWLVEHILENDLKIEKWRKSNVIDLDELEVL